MSSLEAAESLKILRMAKSSRAHTPEAERLAEKIKLARKWHQPPLTQWDLARICGMGRGAVANYEAGYGVPAKAVAEIARALSIPESWFYSAGNGPPSFGASAGHSPPPMTGRAPLWGVVPAGQWERPEQDVEWIAVPERYARPGHFCLRIQGDSMSPLFVAGDVVIVRETPSPPLGSIVVARNGARELTIKRLVSTPKGPRLRSENPDYGEVEPEPGIEYVGQVVFMMRDTW